MSRKCTLFPPGLSHGLHQWTDGNGGWFDCPGDEVTAEQVLRKILQQCKWVDLQDTLLVLDGSVMLDSAERQVLERLLP